MIFSLSSFNHSPQGRRALHDVFAVVGHQLIALGHEVRWTEATDFVGDGVNVVAESFADPRHPALPAIGEAHRRGCRFLYVATECPGAAAFNDAADDPGMRDRQAAFPEACAYASGILHLVPGAEVTAWYGRHAPAAYAELGHAPGLERATGEEPTLDFGFFGKRTVRREAILAWLQRRGTIFNVFDFRPAEQRDADMRTTRVVVQVREHAETTVLSSSRCNTALHLGRPVIAEPHAEPGIWNEIVRFAPTLDDFVEEAASALPRWRELHQGQMERFRDLMTPERCVGEPLRRIGIL